jgi:hypothetical protein
VTNLLQPVRFRGRIALVLGACVVPAGAGLGQRANAGPDKATEPLQFEVATIKPHPEGDHVSSIGGPPGTLANFLSGHFGRTVLDRTGLTGRYDITLQVGLPEQRSADAMDAAIFDALEDQLGLKLVSQREVVDTLIIEHLEQPSEN